MWDDLRQRLRALLNRETVERELDEELSFHVERQVEKYGQVGLEHAQAVRRARIEFGGLDQVKEEYRDSLGVRLIADLRQDVALAARMLRRQPGFTTVAVLSLALGIGANTVIFSVVDAALFRPLPYMHAARLVDVLQTFRNPRGEHVEGWATGRNIDDLRGIRQVFDGVEAFVPPRSKALADGSDGRLSVGAITPDFLSLLGVTPELGRGFLNEDLIGRDRLLLSDAYWRRGFNRDPGVLGRTIALEGQTCVVVGVMPPTFRYFVGANADGWLPLTPRDGEQLVARLRPDLTIERGQRELDAALTNPASSWKPIHVGIEPGDWNRLSPYTPDGPRTRAMLFSLLGAVGLLLGIACANVAHLLLARTMARQREIAVRRSLGATRLRLARQFLAEGLLLSGVGGLAAAAVAWNGIRLLPALMPKDLARVLLQVGLPQLDGRAFAVGCLAAILTGLVCGAAASLRATSYAQVHGLAGGQRVAGPPRRQRYLRDAFQALQVAMTLVLLAGAGLLIASFAKMAMIPLGFNPTNLGYASIVIPQGRGVVGLPPSVFFDDLLARVSAMPGVAAVSVGPPPVSGYSGNKMFPDGAGDATASLPVEMFYVRPDYFRVVGLPLMRGRAFGPEDTRQAPAVAIVSETTAQRRWPGRSALGRQFTEFAGGPAVTIVGVVSDVRTTLVAREMAQVYRPAAQSANVGIVFRTIGDPAPVVAAVRADARALDPRVIVAGIGSVDAAFAEQDPFGSARFYALLLGSLGVVALVTAAAGLFGLVSYSVNRRTHEIGVRLALGAGRSRVRWTMLADAIRPVALGLLLGLIATIWLSRFLASQLFHVTPHDPATLAVVVAVFLAVCASAAAAPATRATRISPTEALRAE